MPTATASFRPASAAEFAARGVAWGLGLFGLLRLNWFEAHALLPLTLWQGRLAAWGFGLPTAPIEVTLACSGADVMALCAGAILAYPATWPKRTVGLAGGIALILALNTVRIGTLGAAAALTSWFSVLHLYIWPALLTLATAGYVFTWMRGVDHAPARMSSPQPAPRATPATRRFVAWAAVFLVCFVAAAPLYMESGSVLATAGFIAGAAAWTLSRLGLAATAAGNILLTPQGAFAVTQECITTPLIPIYLAAAVAYLPTWRQRVLATVAAVPLFVGLGIARLLVIALPATLIGSPVFLIHAFYQLLLAAVVIVLVALWRHGAGRAAGQRGLLGVAAFSMFVYALGPSYTQMLFSAFGGGLPLADTQGAFLLYPAFQVGLYLGLSVTGFIALKWQPFVVGLAAIGISQVAGLAALHLVVNAGVVPHVREVRGLAIVVPLLVVAAMVRYERRLA